MLLITGDNDPVVEPGNTDRLAARARAVGERVAVIHYPGVGHIHTVAALAPSLRWLAPVMRDVRRFVDEETGFGAGR